MSCDFQTLRWSACPAVAGIPLRQLTPGQTGQTACCLCWTQGVSCAVQSVRLRCSTYIFRDFSIPLKYLAPNCFPICASCAGRTQGVSCAVESVRLLNAVLKISGDRLKRAPMVFSEVGVWVCAVTGADTILRLQQQIAGWDVLAAGIICRGPAQACAHGVQRDGLVVDVD